MSSSQPETTMFLNDTMKDIEKKIKTFIKYKKDKINTIIPVMKHLEKCRKISKVLKDTFEKYAEHVKMSYNNDVLDNLTYIESNGLQTSNDIVHSDYNIFDVIDRHIFLHREGLDAVFYNFFVGNTNKSVVYKKHCLMTLI